MTTNVAREAGPVKRVALLTAGGLAPCLSASVASLVKRYGEIAPDVEIIGYLGGYHGLLSGNSIKFTDDARDAIDALFLVGGSPIGNSRVKLTNAKDLVKRGLIEEGQDALKVAADQLVADQVDVLHTIGGDDTNLTAADLARFLHENDYELTVVGMPKTIDNDVVPIKQTLGAWTAAEQGALYARNIVGEHTSNPRMLVVHEVMGRGSGWLTAAVSKRHHDWVKQMTWNPAAGMDGRGWDVHAVCIPELELNIEKFAARLRPIMDEVGAVNVFMSEGAGVAEIVAEMEAAGQEVKRDPFGHVKLDTVNAGKWLAEHLGEALGAEKTMVQKSGYFSRSAAANDQDRELIAACAAVAVDAALAGVSGVAGQDEERDGELRAIEFDRIAGGKPFSLQTDWFVELMGELGQPIDPAREA